MKMFSNHFGKEDITDIQLEDVVMYFQASRTENDKVEFKSYASKDESDPKKKLRTILRSICAFLNSEGGLLIWGAPIGKKPEGKKEKEFTGELSLVETLYEHDALASKIVDSITPTPSGILHHRIESDGKYIYIFDIPKSDYSPHQFEHIYYMRMDGLTKPAPHHYVEALMKKITFPTLVGFLKIEDLIPRGSSGFLLNVRFFIWNLSRFQNDFDVSCGFMADWGKTYGANYDNTGAWSIELPQVSSVIHYGKPLYHDLQIYLDAMRVQNSKSNILKLYISFGAKNSPVKSCEYEIKLSPNMPTKDRILSKAENQFMHEVRKKLGFTDKESIEKVIERSL
jgi:hypothetical protein